MPADQRLKRGCWPFRSATTSCSTCTATTRASPISMCRAALWPAMAGLRGRDGRRGGDPLGRIVRRVLRRGLAASLASAAARKPRLDRRVVTTVEYRGILDVGRASPRPTRTASTGCWWRAASSMTATLPPAVRSPASAAPINHVEMIAAPRAGAILFDVAPGDRVVAGQRHRHHRPCAGRGRRLDRRLRAAGRLRADPRLAPLDPCRRRPGQAGRRRAERHAARGRAGGLTDAVRTPLNPLADHRSPLWNLHEHAFDQDHLVVGQLTAASRTRVRENVGGRRRSPGGHLFLMAFRIRRGERMETGNVGRASGQRRREIRHRRAASRSCASATTPAYAGAIEAYVDGLNTRRGAVFSSNYEYPGRYTRWDTAIIDPPLVISARGRAMRIEALNSRGEVHAAGHRARLLAAEGRHRHADDEAPAGADRSPSRAASSPRRSARACRRCSPCCAR